MKKIIVVSIVLLSAASVAQDAKPVTIPLGTQITARLASQLDSGQVRAGDAVTMDVLEDVKIQNAIVIPKGAIVMGRVNEATGARKMGRGGKLDISFQTVTAADGTKVPVSGDEYAKGKQGYGGGCGCCIVIFPSGRSIATLETRPCVGDCCWHDLDASRHRGHTRGRRSITGDSFSSRRDGFAGRYPANHGTSNRGLHNQRARYCNKQRRRRRNVSGRSRASGEAQETIEAAKLTTGPVTLATVPPAILRSPC